MTLYLQALILVFGLLCALGLYAQSSSGLFVQESIPISVEDTMYRLNYAPIVAYSESVYADSTLLVYGADYLMDFKAGSITLKKTSGAQNLSVSYLRVPEGFGSAQFLYERKVYSDSLSKTLRPSRPLWDFGDNKLSISGSKTFAITFSDDQSFDIKQSLFVNLSGELAENLHIDARLSDSQSKLSPEGDSKELSSLDEVFIKVYGKQYEVAMGDLEWEFKDTKYMNYKSRFEGINLWYKGTHSIQGLYSAGSGKRSIYPIIVSDGKQGPYYLRGGAYQQNFVIIAGSERIYLDGFLLERGLDYSIDYAEGSIMFRRIVTSSHRVVAHFQYSDENYRQNMYMLSSAQNFGDHLSFSQHFIYQEDDRKTPLQYNFNASDLDSLRLSGDSEVWVNGVIEVDPGTGNYRLLYSPEGVGYYQYSPSDSLANFNIYFSYVGFGIGSYEEYSSGKYRYVGEGNGSWIPQKRIIPPAKRLNINNRIVWNKEQLQFGMEGLYSMQDKNTFSAIDDEDNSSAILYAWGRWTSESKGSSFKLDWEQRLKNSFLFGDYSDPGSEHVFGALIAADSLAQYSSSLYASTEFGEYWYPDMLLRYRDIDDLYKQRAMRIGNRFAQKGLLPSLSFISTISKQDYVHDGSMSSLLWYQQLSMSMKQRFWEFMLEALYNGLSYDEELFPASRYRRINPYFIIKTGQNNSTLLSYTYDKNESGVSDWNPVNSSNAYSIKHASATTAHSVNLDATHREVKVFSTQENSGKSSYDLINLRSSHYLLAQAISLLTNYQLNQTEFFPRIRELQFVGSGQGYYDSTGVAIPQGDYDYSYILGEEGTLSTEINAQLNLYFKPAYLSKHPFWQGVMTDIIVQATEHSEKQDGFGHYVFWPGTVYNGSKTIYGRQNLQQTLWLDIIKNRLSSSFTYELNRSVDRRFQSEAQNRYNFFASELELKSISAYNLRFRGETRNETDSRYNSKILTSGVSAKIQRILNPHTSILADLDYNIEKGEDQINADTYSLDTFGITPAIRSVFMQKYRLSASFTGRYNQRSGSQYLSFLPEKRAGFISLWSLQGIYRLNSFSSASLEYSGTSYPKERSKHQFKMEFKAEL